LPRNRAATKNAVREAVSPNGVAGSEVPDYLCSPLRFPSRADKTLGMGQGGRRLLARMPVPNLGASRWASCGLDCFHGRSRACDRSPV
jgi:hypothetical protein